MTRKIIVTKGPYETRAALIENDRPVELFFEQADTQKYIGCIFKGRVSNVVPGTQSAFVDVGLSKDAYLTLGGTEAMTGQDDEDFKDIYRSPIQDVLKIGQEVILQILKEPNGNKGPRSTMALALPGRYLVLMPTIDHVGVSRKINQDKERDRLRAIGRRLVPKGCGVIFRTAAEGLEERELSTDLGILLKVWAKIEAKARTCPPRTLLHRDMPLPLKLARDYFTDDVEQMLIDSEEEYRNIQEMCDFLSPLQRASLELHQGPVSLFEQFGIEREISSALQRKIWLDSGGYLYIDRTEAMTCIDVNSGRFSGGADLEETVFKLNLEAAGVIARQIRLRNLAGMIILDFIDMEQPKHRAAVLKALKDGLRNDRNRPHIVDFSELGLVQMTRRRTSLCLDEILKEPCPCCQGSGQTLSLSTLANRIRLEVLGLAQRFETPAISIVAHQRLVDFWREQGSARLKELESRCGRTLALVAERGLNLSDYRVEPILKPTVSQPSPALPEVGNLESEPKKHERSAPSGRGGGSAHRHNRGRPTTQRSTPRPGPDARSPTQNQPTTETLDGQPDIAISPIVDAGTSVPADSSTQPPRSGHRRRSRRRRSKPRPEAPK
jgi:ribonuclease G